MAAKIKLKRVGKKKKPFYRIVIQDRASATKSEEVDIVGTYNPLASENKARFDEAKVKDWLNKGVAPTDRVRILLGQAGILPLVSFEGKPKRRPKAEQAKEEETSEGKAEAKAEDKEKPEEEKKPEPAEEEQKPPKTES